MPHSRVFGSLGNHDSVPGDVYYGGNEGGDGEQSWEYNNLTNMWAGDLNHDPAALANLKRGGYFAAEAVATPAADGSDGGSGGMGLVVLSLNINYWSTQNSAAAKANSSAQLEG